MTKYERSQELLARAEKVIPLGSQTFSKSKTQYPFGVSPYFIDRGEGGHVWDVDGNEYVDFVGSLAAITLGYNDPDVNQAVKAQLEKGTIFSLPHPIEMEVAEKMVDLIPCAEMVRFGKNGSDATAGAVRLARAHTSRDHVVVCGYHGWQDWYIGTTARSLGVPKATRELTHTFVYNDLSSLEKVFKDHPDQIAAVILEPVNVTEPAPGFLEGVKEMAHKKGSLLIFDETVTGFRYAKGGAQEYFGVTPDLATFGKGMANGYPISAVVGKRQYMKLMEEIFFSFTFGGETLSLAASLAVMKKMEKQPVIEQMTTQGKKIIEGLQKIIIENSCESFMSVAGHPTWSFFILKDTAKYTQWQLKTLFLQEMFERGIITLGSHNLSFAHSNADVDKLLKSYAEVIPMLQDSIEKADLEKRLRCRPLEPLFKIR